MVMRIDLVTPSPLNDGLTLCTNLCACTNSGYQALLSDFLNEPENEVRDKKSDGCSSTLT